MVIVVMGVSGSGKSTFGEALARAEDWDFQEGDALHPAASLDKMRAGIPLDDDDRWPWLDRVTAWIADQLRQHRHGVVACSALKRSYRQRLRRAGADVRFVHIRVPRDELRRRLQQRDHFMPAALLDSQLQTVEEPAADEDVLTLCGSNTPEDMLAAVRRWLDRRHSPAG